MNFPFINTYTILRAEGNKKGTYMGLMSMLFSLAFIIAPILGLPVVELLEQSFDKPMAYKVYWVGCIVLSMVTFLLFRIKRKELDLVSIA